MKSTIRFLPLTISILFGISACTKPPKDGVLNPPPPSSGQLMAYFHTNVSTNDVGVGTPVTAKDASGRSIQLSIAQFYISNIVLINSGGTAVPLTGYTLKLTNSSPMYDIGPAVPVGNYTAISFDVGIDSTTNKISPSSQNMLNAALQNQTPSMWFGSTSQGYIFVNIQGMSDTTGNGTVNCPFSYQIGTSALLRHVAIPISIQVATGNMAMPNICADFGALLKGIDLKKQSTATPFSNMAVATQIANNIPSMFSVGF